MNIDTIENPTLHEINQMTRDAGLIGEEDTSMTIFLSFFGGGLVIVTGRSSGGKDENVDAVEYCCPGDMVAKVPTSLSKTALYEQNQKFNSHPVHRHKDVTALSDKDFLEDIIKRHGQGDSITHSWTEVVPERHEKSRTLESPHCMILFLASDNEQVDINDYPEIRNRALVVGIDDSQELTRRVNSAQADRRAGIIDFNLSEDRTEEIREYVGSIPLHAYSDDGMGTFLNPVSRALDNQNPMPQHFPESRRDFPRLMDFIESVTLFHHDDRLEVPKKRLSDTHPRQAEMLNLLVTPADVWLGMRIFGEKMIMSALNLREKDFALLDTLRDNYGQSFDIDTLRQMLHQRGWNLTDRDVRGALKSMLTKNYVRVDKSVTPHEWTASEFAQNGVNRKVELDWPTVIEDTKAVLDDHYPDDVADEYTENHLTGEGLLVTHPFGGQTVNLSEQEANELEEKAEQAEQREAESVFDSGLGDDGDDSDDDNSGQRTIT